MRLHVSQAVSLVDQLLTIRLTGCRSLQPVTLHLSTAEPYGSFSAVGHFLADANGEVVTDRDRSIGGSYAGLDPMGLFWSMRPDPGQRSGLRFLKRDASEPISLRLRALPGHHRHCDCLGDGDNAPTTAATATFQRTYLSPDVTKTRVDSGRLRGALFSPSSGGSHPGVLDLFGLGGGLMEHRAALLASKGFTVLALAYFGYADLPKRLEAFELDYFVEAVNFLLGHAKVRGPRIGVVGTSAGANVASELAVHRTSQVACCVWLNGIHCRILLPVRYAGRVWTALAPNYALRERAAAGDAADAWSLKRCYDSGCTEAHMVRVEDAANTEFLFISSLDDQGMPSYAGRLLAERLARAGRTNYRLLQYPGAGHLLEPPYSMLNRAVYQSAQKMVADYGGDAGWHNLAQVDVWQQTQDFLRRCLA